MPNATRTLRDRGGDFFAERLRRQMPGLAPQLMQYGSYWPHEHLAGGYARCPNGTAPAVDGFAIRPASSAAATAPRQSPFFKVAAKTWRR
jgi:hypothetical protein